VDAFAALADPVRRSLLRALSTGPRRVVDLAEGLPISRPAVSKHLRLLADAGLVEAEERGRERHYALRPSALQPVAGLLAQLTAPSPLTTNALDALDTEVRRVARDRRTATSTHQQETA
jgi:DNA-binding transcriptional ArsR family regulator